MMEFRKSVYDDAEPIMAIITHAQAFLKGNGVDQWQNGHPNLDVIRKDAESGIGYVLVEDGKVLGTAVIDFSVEEAYEAIYEGQWMSDQAYAAVHRVAVDPKVRGRGLAVQMMQHAETIIREAGLRSIRIDTHRHNLPMQQMLSKSGFQYCGIIYLIGGAENGAERFAYEKLL